MTIPESYQHIAYMTFYWMIEQKTSLIDHTAKVAFITKDDVIL